MHPMVYRGVVRSPYVTLPSVAFRAPFQGPLHSSLMGLLQAVCLSFGLLPLPTFAQAFPLCGSETTVASTDDAAALASALRCSNGKFAVQWVGEVVVEETIHVTNGTSLNITGTAGALADGDFKTRLFSVDGGSSLHLSDMALIQGYASGGGAIYADDSTVSFSGMSSFKNNTAFYEEDSYSYSLTSFSSDYGMYPSSSSGRGGAIHAVSSTLSWNGGDILFIGNNAGFDGGAIWAGDSNVSFNGGTTCKFIGNAGSDIIFGGAIFASGSRLSWDGVGATTFYSNSASQGGAIYVQASNVTWEAGETQFVHNFATDDGALGRKLRFRLLGE